MEPEHFETLVRIETKLDSALERLTDHEARLRSAETHLSRGLGIFAALSVLVTAGWQFLLGKIA